jgi:hypothetical protein
MSAPFENLRSTLAAHGPEAGLAALAEHFRLQKQYHELFEALKMQVRHKLGLPLFYNDTGDELSEAQRNELENGLIAACREVGTLLFQDGKLREGWMYFRPVGDRTEAAKLVRSVPVDEDNYEEMIEVALHEGVDTELGYDLLLKHYGTCNAITTYDQILPRRSRADQQAAAKLLLTRLHSDLVASVKQDILRQEGQMPHEKSLKELVADREWLFHDNAYHTDTTHLSSTVRISRVLSDAESLRLALDLTEYGRRLSAQFQHPGDEPFADMYPSHALFYQALLGENVEEALNYFKLKVEMLDPQYHGLAPLEVYVDLLARIGRDREAMEAAIQYCPQGQAVQGFSTVLMDLAKKAGDYAPMQKFCEERGDLLGYVAGLVEAKR